MCVGKPGTGFRESYTGEAVLGTTRFHLLGSHGQFGNAVVIEHRAPVDPRRGGKEDGAGTLGLRPLEIT